MAAPTGVFRDGSRILRDPQGQLVQVDPDQASKLLTSGTGGKLYSDVTEREVTARDIEATHSTLGAQAETFGRGAAEAVGGALSVVPKVAAMSWGRTPSGPGVPAAVAGAFAEDPERAAQEYEARTRQLEQANPMAYGAGELTANVGLGIATGGISSAAGRSLAGAFARQGLRQGAAEALGTGTAMATEGGFYGAAQAAQSDGATAEQLLQGIGLGALLGGGMGAATGAAGSVFRKIVGKADDVAPSPNAGSPVSEAEAASMSVPASKLGNLYNEASATLSGAEKSTLEKYGLFASGKEAVDGRALWRARNEIIDGNTVPLTNQLDELNKAFDDITEIVRAPKMRKEFVEAVPGHVQASAKTEGISQLKRALNTTDDIIESARADKYGEETRDILSTFSDGMRNRLSELGKHSSAADVNEVVNSIKQSAQKRKMLLDRKYNNSQRAGNISQALAAKEAVTRFEAEVQEPLRQFLESEQYWGQAGRGQADINKSWVSLLSERSPLNKMRKSLFERGQDTYDNLPTFFADSAKTKGFLQQVGTESGHTNQQAIRDAIEGMSQLAENIAKYHELTPAQATQLERLRGAVATSRETLAKVDKTARVANEINQVFESQKQGMAGLVGGGGLAGGVVGGVPGMVLGSIAGMALQPGTGIAVRQSLDSFAQRIGARSTRGVTDWIRSGTGLVTSTIRRGAETVGRAATGTGRVARKVAVPAAVSLFQGRDSTLEAAYERRTNQLLQARQDPSVLLDGITRIAGGLPTVAPGVAGELQAKASAAVEFLASKAPSGTISPTPLNPGRKSVVPRLDMQHYARIWAAVEKPETVVADLRRGVATPGQIEALKSVHPETYEAIRTAAQAALLDVAQRGKRIPTAMRQQLDMLLDLGGAGEPAFSDAVSDRISKLQAQKQQERPDAPRPTKTPNLTVSVALPQQQWPTAKG